MVSRSLRSSSDAWLEKINDDDHRPSLGRELKLCLPLHLSLSRFAPGT